VVSAPVPTIGINGFGRIGRALFRICLDRDDVDMVAVNHTAASIEHLLMAIRHDSTHGPCRHSSELSVAPADHPGLLKPTEKNPNPSALLYKGKLIHLFSERDPAKLDWSSAGADYIMESTGKMTTVDKAAVHISEAKGKKVIISAPSKDARNIVFGVNQGDYAGEDVVSNASCTTNCLAPVAAVLHRAFGVETGMMTTIHASTASQKVLDGFSAKDMRSGRSAMGNIIPATTGAAQAVVKVLPELAGKFQGMSVRVPVTNVSLVDLTVKTIKPFNTKEELMGAFKAAANTPVSEGGLKGVLGVCEEKLVSSDYLTSSQSSIIDIDASVCLDGQTAKIIAWYDNEYGFANRMVDLAIYMAAH
jgi:glyceraldehyde 3-phosphate dehydrogenase